MKKIEIIITAFALLFLAGCSSTEITKTVYNTDGTVESVEETSTSESPIVVAMGNLENKHVIAHMGGWYAGIGVDPNTSIYGIKAGSIDNTYASLVATKDGVATDAAAVVQYFPAIVDASKYSLSISVNGINSEGNSTSETQTSTPTTQETTGE